MDEDSSLRSTVAACNLRLADLPAGAQLVVDRLEGAYAEDTARVPAAHHHLLARSERGMTVAPQPQYLMVHSFVLLYVDATVAQADAPTLLCARREMQSWLQLQLEPTALRRSCAFNDAPRLQPNGEGLAAALFRIARGSKEPKATYARIANRLAELVSNVSRIDVERNEKLEQLTLMLTDREGTEHAARSLSDGTLRFLALTVLEMDPEAHGVLCLEEPENGIHPDHIGSMIRLLQDIAFDPETTLGPENPLRQVVVNTHSPLVVAECPDDSLILAHPVEDVRSNRVFNKVVFSGLDGTWRTKTVGDRMSKGELMAFLSPVSLRPVGPEPQPNEKRRRRIRERQDLRQCFLVGFEERKVAEE